MFEAINALDKDAFVARFGELFEHSPWVVESAASLRPFNDHVEMLAAFLKVLEQAGGEKRLELLLAHPELAGKVAIDNELTHASAQEQASAGLDRMTPDEFRLFHDLNADYRTKFGFPFIICVLLTDKAGILAAMRERLENQRETELETAICEVMKIVELRLRKALV